MNPARIRHLHPLIGAASSDSPPRLPQRPGDSGRGAFPPSAGFLHVPSQVAMSAVLAPQGASTSSVTPIPRNPAQLLATRLLKIPLSAIAQALGCDESGACRVRANERPCTLSGWLKLIDLCGYKLVGKDKMCVHQDEFALYRRAYLEKLAREGVELRFDVEDPE